MSEMVEKVAKAICLQAFGYESPMESDKEIARTAIVALMEPTEEMERAGEAPHDSQNILGAENFSGWVGEMRWEMFCCPTCGWSNLSGEHVRVSYQAMLRAALDEL